MAAPDTRQMANLVWHEIQRRWNLVARQNQLPPDGDWVYWLAIGGRGGGKTRTGAEWIRSCIENNVYGVFAFVGRTAADVRDVMVDLPPPQGRAGILSLNWKSGYEPRYIPSKSRIEFGNGAIAHLYSAEEPDSLRGPQHEAAWCDELCYWKYPQETWDNLQFGLRSGMNPRICITTTPRPIKLLKNLIDDDLTIMTRMTTYDNIDNLAPSFADRIIKKYEGTRLGRQELNAEILEDIEGALWKRSTFDKNRVSKHPDLVRIVVAIDPAASSNDDSDETGIVVAGRGVDNHGYMLADLSCQESPAGWAQKAVNVYQILRADAIIAEANNGGEMIEHTIHTVNSTVKVKLVHASRGKMVRAEPIASLDEQGLLHQVGIFGECEDQCCTYVQGDPKSPDRMDARVWAFTELMLVEEDGEFWLA